MKRKDLSDLRSEIKEVAEQGRTMNGPIQAAKGPERHELRLKKAAVGWSSRHLLLAYLFLREVPYVAGESKCRKNNGPSANAILEQASRFIPGLEANAVTRWLEAS